MTQTKNCDFLRIIKIVFKVSAFYLKYTKYIQNPKLPVITHERRVPKPLHDKLEVGLVWVITLDVTEFVTEPTECVSTLVTVKQSNNILRVCFNSKDLKKQSKDSISKYS